MYTAEEIGTVWNNIRPQLEETLRLRREKLRRLARAKRERSVCSQALSVLKSEKGKLCILSFGELLELPLVKEFLEGDSLDATIGEDVSEVIERTIVDIGTRNKGKVEWQAASDLMAAFSGYDLLPSGAQSPAEALPVDLSVLNHSCAFFRGRSSYSDGFRSFSDISQEFVEDTKGTYVCADRHPINYLSELDIPHRRAISVAKRLVEKLDVVNSTMEELQELGNAFICTRCDPLFRRKRSWSSLVCAIVNRECID